MVGFFLNMSFILFLLIFLGILLERKRAGLKNWRDKQANARA